MSSTASPDFTIGVPVDNEGPETLRLGMQVLNGASELSCPTSGWIVGAQTYCWLGMGDVSRRRLHTIRLRLWWQKGSVSGSKSYAITPKQDNTTP